MRREPVQEEEERLVRHTILLTRIVVTEEHRLHSSTTAAAPVDRAPHATGATNRATADPEPLTASGSGRESRLSPRPAALCQGRNS